MPGRRTIIIRTVADLAKLGDDELANCLRALRSSIQTRKALHAQALESGDLHAGTALEYDQFEWRPLEGASPAGPSGFSGDTPVDGLPLRYWVRVGLRQRNVYCLEDFSQMSETELRSMKDVGATTVERVRELLAEIGLSFKEEPNPFRAARKRSQAIRALPESAIADTLAGLGDDEPIARLGLRGGTLIKAMKRSLLTVGDIRKLTPRDLFERFGRSEGRELLGALASTGSSLRCAPSQLELWRYGLLPAEQLVRPQAPDTPVEALAPWIKFAVQPLQSAGVATLGQLRERARTGGLSGMRGLGAAHVKKLLEFLGTAQCAEGPAPPPAARPANSVFDVG